MDADHHQPTLPGDLAIPDDREPLGRAHQLRVDISIAISLAPSWLRRALSDKNGVKVQRARMEIVERIAAAIERRFVVTWLGSREESANARPTEQGGPLFGGPDLSDALTDTKPEGGPKVDSVKSQAEHKANI